LVTGQAFYHCRIQLPPATLQALSYRHASYDKNLASITYLVFLSTITLSTDLCWSLLHPNALCARSYWRPLQKQDVHLWWGQRAWQSCILGGHQNCAATGRSL